MRRLVGILGLLCFVGAGAVGAVTVWRFAGTTFDALTFPVQVAPGLTPRLSGADAYRITLDYLNSMRPDLAAPSLHIDPAITGIWAVTASQAASLDGCIPTGKGGAVVWVTKGTGDYLDLRPYAWSRPSTQSDTPAQLACNAAGQAGTIVIDDATGVILGVYPYAGPSYPHPSPAVPTPSF